MEKRFSSIICFLFVWLVLPVYGQEDTDPYALEDSISFVNTLFNSDEPAEISLKFNFKDYRKNRYQDKYIPAELIYDLGDSTDSAPQTVKIKARGTNRKEVCSFPPIRLNIKNTDLQDYLLPDTKKLKLVTHCKSYSTRADYLLREYLVYRIYNILTPYSFRVRLVKIRYIDTGKKKKTIETWAFLIEPEEMMARRLNMFSLKYDHLSIHHTDPEWTGFMSIFQYMIGNDDFSVQGRHNIKLLKSKDPLEFFPIPVPYDFDLSGMVNADYATPRESLGLKTVRDRYFLGPCQPFGEYLKVIRIYQAKKNEINDYIDQFEYLPQNERSNVKRYLDEFYADSYSITAIRSILSTCEE